MGLTPLKVVILGDSSGGEKALGSLESKAASSGDGIKHALEAVAAITVAATASVVAFAKSSVDRYQEVASQTLQLQRITGASAETVSRLRFAAEETGVSVDSLGIGIKKLSVNMEGHNKALNAAKIEYTDVHGKMLPVDQVLGNVAAKFASMPNGVAKNTLAVQLFGKSGTDLIPVLNKGRDGLSELEKEADKFGLTLTQSNLDAIHKNVVAHQQFAAAVQGLQVQLGAGLLPIITTVVELFVGRAIPVIEDVTHWIQQKLDPAFAKVSDTLRTKVSPEIQKLSDFIKGTFQPILGTLSSSLTGNVLNAFKSFSIIGIAGTIVAIAEFTGALKELAILDLLVNPFSLAVAAVIGLSVAFATLTGHGAAVQGFMQSISNAVSGLNFDSLRAKFVHMFDNVTPDLSQFLGRLGAALGKDGQSLLDALATAIKTGNLSQLGAALSTVVIQSLKALAAAAGDVANAFVTLFNSVPWAAVGAQMSKSIKSLMSGIDWENVAESVGGAVAAVLGGSAKVITAISAAFGKLLGKIDWAGLGMQLGAQVPALLLGLSMGLINFNWSAVWRGIVLHWKEILFVAIGLIPFGGKIAEILAKTPFMGPLLSAVVRELTRFSKGFFDVGGKVLTTIIDGFLKGVGAIEKDGSGIADLIDAFTTWVYVHADDFYKAVKAFVHKAPQAILDAIGSVAQAMGVFIGHVIDEWRPAASWLYGHGRELIDGLWSGITDAAGAVWKWFRGVSGNVLGALGDTESWLIDAGKKIVQGLINGITSMGDKVGNAASGIANKVKSFFPFSPAKEGPLSGRGDPYYSGISIVSSLSRGLRTGAPIAASSAGEVARSVSGSLGLGPWSPALSAGAAAAAGGSTSSVSVTYGDFHLHGTSEEMVGTMQSMLDDHTNDLVTMLQAG